MFNAAFRHTRLGVFALSISVLLLGNTNASADQIDRVMVEDAGAIAKAVYSLKAKNVAILKFQVKVGDALPTFKCGTEGAEMVHRLENLLVLSLDPKSPDYTVLTKATETASALAKATKTPIDWTTTDGRKKLFEVKLPVCWDDKDTRTPDAYVTGTVVVSKNLQEVKIELNAFARTDPVSLKKLGTLTGALGHKGIWADRAMLASLGQTYTTNRDLKPTGQARDFFAADESAAADAASRENKPPPTDPTSGVASLAGPVSLKIRFDGEPIRILPDEARRGDFKVSGRLPTSGTPGQRVTFTVINNSAEKLAMLLCVNGRNTISLDGETLDNLDKPRSRFRMYVLEPKILYEIKGFLKDEKGTIGEILVSPEDESSALFDQMNPETRGKIQMFIYGPTPLRTPAITEGTPPDPAMGPVTGNDNPETAFDNAFAASGLSIVDKSLGKKGNLAAAQRSLEARTRLTAVNGKLTTDPKLALGRSRGLFIETKETTKTGAPFKVVKFNYDDQPLDSVVINYYVK